MNTMFSALGYIIETMFVVGILGSSIVVLEPASRSSDSWLSIPSR